MDGADGMASLGALTKRQQRVVEKHLPLVGRTLLRHRALVTCSRAGHEASELYQEGCMALVETVRSHDPAAHGDFAAYAMARIHFAMSRFAHEQECMIRVPYITQRRYKKRRDDRDSEKLDPGRPPRVVRRDMEEMPGEAPGRGVAKEAEASGERMRERYERAARQVADEMMRSARCAAGNDELVQRCLEERWMIPEPEERTPIRELARELACSVGRVNHCEERFRRRMTGLLRHDEDWAALTADAKRRAAE